MIREAIMALVPNAQCIYSDAVIMQWHDTRPQPTEEELQAKITELTVAEPMRILRQERTQLLAQSDWMANSDVTMTEEWRVYRQALRDITTQTPSLDENGQLTGIIWPTPPND